jgi:TolB-like protein/tetratricopeptide (TPR) repeat protein
LVTGVPTFIGPTTQSVIAQRLTREPSPVAQFRESTPAVLERIIEKALMKTPADRFQSTAEFIAALDKAARVISGPHVRTVVTARRMRRRYIAAGALGVIALGAAAGVQWKRTRASDADPIPAGDPRRVAVLYFDDLTPEIIRPEVADGITEDLIDRLGSVRALRVTSPNGVRPFRGAQPSVDSIAKVLKAGTIVGGSVARSGDSVQVKVRMISGATGANISSQTLTEPWTELFGLQARLTEQVQTWLRQRLGDEIAVRTTRAGTRSVKAWELAQEAKAEERRGSSGAGALRDTTAAPFLRADSLYRAAARVDPSWAYPVVRRAALGMYALALRSTRAPDGTDFAKYRAMSYGERRRAWARQAVSLTSQVLKEHERDASALTMRASATIALSEGVEPKADSMLAAAQRDLNMAIEERPDLAQAWVSRAELSQRLGNFQDAVVAARRAVDTDAFLESRMVMEVAFNSALFGEQFDEARSWCQMSRRRYPGDPTFAECELRLLGSTGRSAHDADLAWRLVGDIERADTAHALDVTWGFRRLMVATILARGARPDSARRVLELVQRTQPDYARRASELAACWVLTLLGDRSAAVQRLELLLQDPNPPPYPVYRLPWFTTLRGDPRYDSLAARRGGTTTSQ